MSAWIKEPLAGGKRRPGTEEMASRLELFLKSRRPKQFASKRVHSGTESFHVHSVFLPPGVFFFFSPVIVVSPRPTRKKAKISWAVGQLVGR